jgi:hypothetical protein
MFPMSPLKVPMYEKTAEKLGPEYRNAKIALMDIRIPT